MFFFIIAEPYAALWNCILFLDLSGHIQFVTHGERVYKYVPAGKNFKYFILCQVPVKKRISFIQEDKKGDNKLSESRCAVSPELKNNQSSRVKRQN